MRKRRRSIAGWVALGWLFAQIVTVAHACPALLAAADDSVATPAVVAAPMPGDCASMAKQAGSTANVCQSHCIGSPQVGGDVQTPCAPLAPQAPLTVRSASSEVPVSANIHTSHRGARPPPTLAFSRLLI